MQPVRVDTSAFYTRVDIPVGRQQVPFIDEFCDVRGGLEYPGTHYTPVLGHGVLDADEKLNSIRTRQAITTIQLDKTHEFNSEMRRMGQATQTMDDRFRTFRYLLTEAMALAGTFPKRVRLAMLSRVIQVMTSLLVIAPGLRYLVTRGMAEFSTILATYDDSESWEEELLERARARSWETYSEINPLYSQRLNIRLRLLAAYSFILHYMRYILDGTLMSIADSATQWLRTLPCALRRDSGPTYAWFAACTVEAGTVRIAYYLELTDVLALSAASHDGALAAAYGRRLYHVRFLRQMLETLNRENKSTSEYTEALLASRASATQVALAGLRHEAGWLVD